MFGAKKRDKVDGGMRAQQIDVANAFAVNAGLVGQQCDSFSLERLQSVGEQNFDPGGDMPDWNCDRFDSFFGFWLDRISCNGGYWKQRHSKDERKSHHQRVLENGMRRKEKGPEVSLQPFMCSLPKRLKRQGHPPDQF
jgi:hypothetical protein